MTDELGSCQRDQSTSSVTKWANGHWHAIIASSCRWSEHEYKRQQVHHINSSFRFGAERQWLKLLLSFPQKNVLENECVRYGAAAVVTVARERKGSSSCWQPHQECAVASSPACLSTKRVFLWKSNTGDRVFLKMFYHPCISGCDRYLVLSMVTVAASRAWAFSMLRKFSWMVHVLLVGT